MVVAGIKQSGRDQTAKIMSTDFDLIYVPEAIEFTEEEWEKLTTRLRNNRMPYQQLIADTNPGPPTHWLKNRCDRGQCRLLLSDHTDNPALWDASHSRWTPFGITYISKLDGLTGARKQRLRYGKWVQAEGVVYEGWNQAVHVIDRFPIPADWRRFIGIDFGFTNSFVAQFWALDPDSRLYLYREYVKTKTLVEDHARRLKSLLAGEPAPEAIITDHDAEDRATFERHFGCSTVPARKNVSAGIQSVAERLVVQPDGKPRMFVFSDALVERDPELEDSKKPIGLTEEIDGYCWSLIGGARSKEEPVKENDHSCDVARYICAHLEGSTWLAPRPELLTAQPGVLDGPNLDSIDWRHELPRKSQGDWRGRGRGEIGIDWRGK